MVKQSFVPLNVLSHMKRQPTKQEKTSINIRDKSSKLILKIKLQLDKESDTHFSKKNTQINGQLTGKMFEHH